jgi:perosamine synthetase
MSDVALRNATLALLGGPPAVDVPHPRPWPRYREEDALMIADLVRAGRVYYQDSDPLIDELATLARGWSGCAHALSFNAGTHGLLAAYFALGLGPGDEVLVPTLTHHATITPLLQLGATPVFCDCDPANGNIDAADAATRITGRTRALVVTHLWGHPADMDALVALARQHKLKLVEDASHAHGATWRGQPVGSFGDVAMFSLGTMKMVTGGGCGVLVTNDRRIYERALALGHYPGEIKVGVSDKELARAGKVAFGLNLRPSLLPVALVIAHAKRLPELIETRARNFMTVTAALEGVPGVRPIPIDPRAKHGAWHGYKLVYDAAALGGLPMETFIAAVRAEGARIEHEKFGPQHLQPVFAMETPPLPIYERGGARLQPPAALPNSLALHARLISLPGTMFNEPAEDLAYAYARAIAKVATQAGVLLEHAERKAG